MRFAIPKIGFVVGAAVLAQRVLAKIRRNRDEHPTDEELMDFFENPYGLPWLVRDRLAIHTAECQRCENVIAILRANEEAETNAHAH